MVEGWKKKHAYIGFIYIPAKGFDLKSFTIFNLRRQTVFFCCLINNAVTKSQDKIALKYVVIPYLV